MVSTCLRGPSLSFFHSHGPQPCYGTFLKSKTFCRTKGPIEISGDSWRNSWEICHQITCDYLFILFLSHSYISSTHRIFIYLYHRFTVCQMQHLGFVAFFWEPIINSIFSRGVINLQLNESSQPVNDSMEGYLPPIMSLWTRDEKISRWVGWSYC